MVFWWVPEDGTDYSPVFNGTFEGGKSYGVILQFEHLFGYEFDADNIKVKANGVTAETVVYDDDRYYDVIALVQAEHDWGEWEQTKAPTSTEPGEEKRSCKHCGETETRPIPPTGVEFFVLTFNLGGGTLDGKTTVVYKGYKEGTTITMPEPTRPGYRFLYWEGSKYYAGQEYTVTGDHTFTAVWEKIPDTGGRSKTPGTGDPATLAWLGVAAAGAASALAGRALRRRED